MELPVLDKFCFKFQLRTGCITMGVVNSILTFVLDVVLISFYVDIKTAQAASKREEVDTVSAVVSTIVLMMVALLIVKFVCDMIFVYAVYKEKRNLVKNYCIFWVVFLVLYIIGFLKSLFHMSAGHVITQILFLAENIYYIVVIRSYLISIHGDGVL